MQPSSSNWRPRLALPAGLLTLVIIGSVMDSRHAAAQADPKGVTIAGPLPLPVTGTVNANQSGAWNVGVLGTPSVNVANTPSVVVGNTDSSAVWIRDATEARQAVKGFVILGMPGGAGEAVDSVVFRVPSGGLGGGISTAAIPAGKRLVIEYASANCTLPTGQAAILTLSTDVNGMGNSPNALTLSPAAVGGITSVGGSVRIYADPGAGGVHAKVNRTDTTGAASCDVEVNGHLVSVP